MARKLRKELQAALNSARAGLALAELPVDKIVEHAKQNSRSVRDEHDALVWTIGYLQATLQQTVRDLEAVEGE